MARSSSVNFGARKLLIGLFERLRRQPQTKFWHRQLSAGVIKIIMPTINSARYIDIILSYYRDMNIPVTVFVDSKTTDETAAIAARYAHEVITFKNPATRVGEMIEGMSRLCRTRWILRIDDDELPSIRMMEFVRGVISCKKYHVVGFNRYQCIFNCSGDLYQNLVHDPHTHRQWRLYRPDKVTFHGRGHSPGFDFEYPRGLNAPLESFLIHLDWVVHSREERMEKLTRYDAHTPGHGMPFKSYYLADESAGFREELRPLPSLEFDQIGRQLVARFPESAVLMKALNAADAACALRRDH